MSLRELIRGKVKEIAAVVGGEKNGRSERSTDQHNHQTAAGPITFWKEAYIRTPNQPAATLDIHTDWPISPELPTPQADWVTLKDRYQIDQKPIHTTPHAEMYFGYDQETGQPVAIKLILDTPASQAQTNNPPSFLGAPEGGSQLDRFWVSEGEFAQHHNLPGFLPAIDTFEVETNQGRQQAIVYQWLSDTDMPSLAHLTKKDGKRLALVPEVAFTIWFGVVHALTQAAENGVAHHDIKPSNVLVNREKLLQNLPKAVSMTDYGLVNIVKRPPTAVGIGGTEGFRAPEIAQNRFTLKKLLQDSLEFQRRRSWKSTTSLNHWRKIAIDRMIRKKRSHASTDKPRKRSFNSIRPLESTLESRLAGHYSVWNQDQAFSYLALMRDSITAQNYSLGAFLFNLLTGRKPLLEMRAYDDLFNDVYFPLSMANPAVAEDRKEYQENVKNLFQFSTSERKQLQAAGYDPDALATAILHILALDPAERPQTFEAASKLVATAKLPKPVAPNPEEA